MDHITDIPQFIPWTADATFGVWICLDHGLGCGQLLLAGDTTAPGEPPEPLRITLNLQMIFEGQSPRNPRRQNIAKSLADWTDTRVD